jgi:hypothetical protein
LRFRLPVATAKAEHEQIQETAMTDDAGTEARISPRYMLLLIVTIPLFAWLYFLVGTRFFDSPLSLEEYVVFTTLIAIIVTGCYQLFFWVQRNNYYFKKRCFVSPWDNYIPFWPSWVWIYSFLYYIAIGFVVASIQSIAEGVYLVFGAILLLLAQVFFFFFFPSTVPPEYRQYDGNNFSTRYLKFVQGNMHCSIAMYVSLVLYPAIGNASWVFIGLIAISCLLVKQHQMADILPGIALGWAVWSVAPTI